MFPIQHNQGEFFEIKFLFVVYGYDPNTKIFKDPVHELFQVQFDMLNLCQNTVHGFSDHLMTLKPAMFSGVNFSSKFFVHHILPPVVYPCNPTAIKVAEVVKRYKDIYPFSCSMTITTNVIETYEMA